jgi:uncharacterized protein (TIGR03435 family)
MRTAMLNSRLVETIGIVAVVGGIVGVLSAQTPTGSTFEVVSIKRNASGTQVFAVSDRPDGGITATNIFVGTLIARAYPPATPGEIVGLPDWAKSERYDVMTTSSLSRPTPDDRTAMLRAMLADRFKLTVHVESHSQPVYDLFVARSDGRLGAGLAATEIDCEARIAAERAAADSARAAGTPPAPRQVPDLNAPAPRCALRVVNDRVEGDTPMANFAMMLRTFTGRNVVDKTGLTGFYRVTMNFDSMGARRGPDTAPARPDAPPSIFTALQEQLGLRLESEKGAGDVLVIDHVEHPTED